MKVTWQSTLLVATSAICCVVAASAQQSEDRTKSRPASKQAASDEIVAVNCFLNLIDRKTIAAGRAGVLASVTPEEGHTVKAGEVVAKVKDEVAAAQFATADKQAKNDIEIRFAEKSAELAELELFRAQTANQTLKGTVTGIEIARLELARDRAKLQIENAKKEFDIAGSKRDEAGEMLQTHVVETSMGGLCTKVYKHTGEAVREGDAIIDIVNNDRMRVAGYVPYAQVNRISIGDKVSVKLDIPEIDLPEEEIAFEGKITFIDLTVSRANRLQVKVYAEVPNKDGILRDLAPVTMVVSPRKALAPMNVTTRREVPRRAPVDAE